MKIARVLFCSILLFTQSLFSDGFVAGTPVKTAAGFVPIENLKVGDVVASREIHSALESKQQHSFFALERPIRKVVLSTHLKRCR